MFILASPDGQYYSDYGYTSDKLSALRYSDRQIAESAIERLHLNGWTVVRLDGRGS